LAVLWDRIGAPPDEFAAGAGGPDERACEIQRCRSAPQSERSRDPGHKPGRRGPDTDPEKALPAFER
jgi:hypothetical protein